MWMLVAVIFFNMDVPGEAAKLEASWKPVSTLEECKHYYEVNRKFLEQWLSQEKTANAGYMKCIEVSQ